MEPKRERHKRDSDGDRIPLPLEVAAYSLFGGVSVKRGRLASDRTTSAHKTQR
jgi:hypothetical protein